MKRILAVAAWVAIMSLQAQAQTPAPNSQLCLSQLELLVSGERLTEAEAEVFEAQCACLEEQEQNDDGDGQSSCTQE